MKNPARHLTFQNPCYIKPVGGLHGKLTVLPKFAPACPATPCGVRRHDAALEPGDKSPRLSHRASSIKPNQTITYPHPGTGPFRVFAFFAVPPSPAFPIPEIRDPEPPQSRQKPQQSSLIKPNQGKHEMSHSPQPARRPGRSKLDVGCFSTPFSAPHSRLPLTAR